MSNAPAKKFRVGYITATIWKNTTDGRDYYSVDVTRTYKEGEDLKNTSSLGHADLLRGGFVRASYNRRRFPPRDRRPYGRHSEVARSGRLVRHL